MSNKVENVNIEKYSEKSFVVRGETKEHKEKLSDLGGKWNSRLRDGAGWIFPNMLRKNVENWINHGIIVQKKRYNSSEETFTPNANVGKILKEVLLLKKEVCELKNLIKQLINNGKDEEIIESDSDSEEEIIPKKRLLRRK